MRCHPLHHPIRYATFQWSKRPGDHEESQDWQVLLLRSMLERRVRQGQGSHHPAADLRHREETRS